MFVRWIPRRWALCLLGSALFLGFLGGVAWKWAVPWMIEIKLGVLLQDRGLEGVHFDVATTHLGELKLTELHLGDSERWRLEVPEMTLHASLDELRRGSVPRLSVPWAKVVVNLNAFPGAGGWMTPERKADLPVSFTDGGRLSPLESLQIERLVVELHHHGQSLGWSGPFDLTAGATWTVEHTADEGDAQFTAKAILDEAWQVTEMHLGGQWLQPDRIGAMWASGRKDAASSWVFASDQALSFQGSLAVDGTWRGEASVPVIEVAGADVRGTFRQLQVEATRGEGPSIQAVVRAEVEDLARGPWRGRGGKLEWETQGDEGAWTHQCQIKQMSLHRDQSIEAQLSGRVSTEGKGARWSGQWVVTEAAVGGRLVAPFAVQSLSADQGSFPWHFTVPEIRFADEAPVRLNDLTVALTDGAFEGSAAHFMDYGDGERYGPVPVKLSGQALGSPGSWEVQLLANTQPDQPWQGYWKGLGFLVNGQLTARGILPSKQWTVDGSFPTIDLRRNESVVRMMNLQTAGSMDLATTQWALNLEGISENQRFHGDIAGTPAEEGGRVVRYEIKDLQVPQNTLLGAFAEALIDVPIAATLGGSGQLEFPPAGEGGPEHRMSLHLREGTYSHLRRHQEGTGIDAMVAVESLDPFVTVNDQQAAFAEWVLGDLRLTNGRFLYQLGPKGAVLIREAEAEGLGGRVSMESLAYHPGHPDFESAVTFSDVHLEDLAAIVPGLKGKVGGQVSGRVHLRFKDGVLSLPRGNLTMAEGTGGFLRINAEETLGTQLADLVEDPHALQIVERALKDLLIHEFEVGFFDPEQHDSVCRIRLKGRSRKKVPIPKTNGGMAIAPIHLNINVDDPSEWVRRLLDFGLRQKLQAIE